MPRPVSNIPAASFMVFSMLAFAAEDMFLKISAVAMPSGQVIAVVGAAGGLCFWVLAALNNQPIIDKRALFGAAFLRTISEAIAAACYISALALIPLTLYSALLQAAPLVVTMGAALFLKETVGWRRWGAIFAGLVGVLIILRPGTDDFNPATLLTIMGVVALAVRDLATRAMPQSIGTFQLTTWAYLGLFPTGVLLMFAFNQPAQSIALNDWPALISAIATGMIGYWAIITAMRIGEASFIAPFRYTRLIFGMSLGVIFLNESVDIYTIIGSSLVIVSGLYSFWREVRRKKEVLSIPQF